MQMVFFPDSSFFMHMQTHAVGTRLHFNIKHAELSQFLDVFSLSLKPSNFQLFLHSAQTLTIHCNRINSERKSQIHHLAWCASSATQTELPVLFPLSWKPNSSNRNYHFKWTSLWCYGRSINLYTCIFNSYYRIDCIYLLANKCAYLCALNDIQYGSFCVCIIDRVVQKQHTCFTAWIDES